MYEEKNMNHEALVKQALREVKSIGLASSPYLKTRVLAELRDRKQDSILSKIKLWKRIALVSTSLCLGLTLFSFYKQTPNEQMLQASINIPYMVKLSINEFQGKFESAEISVPDGVTFYSKSYPAIQKQRILELEWENSLGRSHLIFVVKGMELGEKKVKVKFYDSQGALISEKTLKIDFRTRG